MSNLSDRGAVVALLIACCMPGSVALGSPVSMFAPGDLQIIGYRSNNNHGINLPKGVSFVTWRPLDAGETIYFSDTGFYSDGTYRGGEGNVSWTSSVALAAGTVVRIQPVITAGTGGVIDFGTAVGNFSNLNSSVGDQIFAGTAAFNTSTDNSAPGHMYTGNLLYGLDYYGATGWETNILTPPLRAVTSALPSVLNNSVSNFTIPFVQNAEYAGPRSGLSIDQYKSAIADASKWRTNSAGGGASGFRDLNGTAFQIAVPEPSGLLLGLVGVGMYLATRRRRQEARSV